MWPVLAEECSTTRNRKVVGSEPRSTGPASLRRSAAHPPGWGGLWRCAKQCQRKLGRPPQSGGRAWAARFDAATPPCQHFTSRNVHANRYPTIRLSMTGGREHATAPARARPLRPRPRGPSVPQWPESVPTVAGGLTLRMPPAYPSPAEGGHRWSRPPRGVVRLGSKVPGPAMPAPAAIAKQAVMDVILLVDRRLLSGRRRAQGGAPAAPPRTNDLGVGDGAC
jgi:hypothetical protein